MISEREMDGNAPGDRDSETGALQRPMFSVHGAAILAEIGVDAARIASLCAERMLKFFAFGHLREDLKAVSKPFSELAHYLVEIVPEGPERTVALRKLLEAKDAAVRAVAIRD
jgi:hypothetical protein